MWYCPVLTGIGYNTEHLVYKHLTSRSLRLRRANENTVNELRPKFCRRKI